MQSKTFLALLTVFFVSACESQVDLCDTGEPLLSIGRTVGGEFSVYEDLDEVGIRIAPSTRNSAFDIRLKVGSPDTGSIKGRFTVTSGQAVVASGEFEQLYPCNAETGYSLVQTSFSIDSDLFPTGTPQHYALVGAPLDVNVQLISGDDIVASGYIRLIGAGAE